MAMTSPYVEKRYVLGTEPIDANATVELIDLETTGLASHLLDHGLREDMSGSVSAAFKPRTPPRISRRCRCGSLPRPGRHQNSDRHRTRNRFGCNHFRLHGDIEQLLSSAADLHGPSLENTVLVGVKNATVDHKRALASTGYCW